MLKKPTVLSLPSMSSPLGVGISACNSGNACPSQKCDITKANQPYDATDDANWFLDVITFIVDLFK